MGPHYLSHFFTPESVAVVGASIREDSVGHRLLLNMKEAGFNGRLYPVDHNRKEILGYQAYPDIDSIKDHLDLVVIASCPTALK